MSPATCKQSSCPNKELYVITDLCYCLLLFPRYTVINHLDMNEQLQRSTVAITDIHTPISARRLF